MKRIAVLVSGGGTNLQAILDAQKSGLLKSGRVELVLSSKAGVYALERARQDSGQPPPVALVLPEHVARRDAPVRPHALGSYDRQPDEPPEHPPDPLEKPDD